ncbi:MAG: type II toxin-antitoxin system RelE/ParE family toxin [Chloroflexota bacterium]
MSPVAVTFLPSASEEVEAARLWYRRQSAAAVQGFRRELDHAVAMIAEGPERHPPHLYGTRKFLLRRFPFMIVYRLDGGAVQVIAIAHTGRRPGYWRDR